MGIADLPEVKEQFEAARAETGRQLLQEKATASVKADPAEVERILPGRRAGVEGHLGHALLRGGEPRSCVADVKAGKDFGGPGDQAGGRQEGAGGRRGRVPAPRQAAARRAGRPGGHQGGRPERAGQGQGGLGGHEGGGGPLPGGRQGPGRGREGGPRAPTPPGGPEKYYDGIIKRYATVDQALLKSLDFEAKVPGIAALEKDKRVVAQVKGGKDVTVADLTAR